MTILQSHPAVSPEILDEALKLRDLYNLSEAYNLILNLDKNYDLKTEARETLISKMAFMQERLKLTSLTIYLLEVAKIEAQDPRHAELTDILSNLVEEGDNVDLDSYNLASLVEILGPLNDEVS